MKEGGVVPDESAQELIERLCVAAGALMEDYSGMAVATAPAASREQIAWIEKLRVAASDMVSLLTAAEAIARRATKSGT
jgi:hypothetical protein